MGNFLGNHVLIKNFIAQIGVFQTFESFLWFMVHESWTKWFIVRMKAVSIDTYTTRLQRYKYLNAKCVIGELIVNMVGSPDGIADASV